MRPPARTRLMSSATFPRGKASSSSAFTAGAGAAAADASPFSTRRHASTSNSGSEAVTATPLSPSVNGRLNAMPPRMTPPGSRSTMESTRPINFVVKRRGLSGPAEVIRNSSGNTSLISLPKGAGRREDSPRSPDCTPTRLESRPNVMLACQSVVPLSESSQGQPSSRRAAVASKPPRAVKATPSAVVLPSSVNGTPNRRPRTGGTVNLSFVKPTLPSSASSAGQPSPKRRRLPEKR